MCESSRRSPDPHPSRRLSTLKGAPMFAGTLLSLFLLAPSFGQAQAAKESRYPYDPACPWGRLANGQGMLHRCLTEAEARRLAGVDPAKVSPAEGLPPPKDAPAEGSEPTGPNAIEIRDFTIQVGPIRADKGDITIGKLGVPLDRYKACVLENGGLTQKSAKLVVEFLVQAERSRAEGVEVVKTSGLTQKAARCIADVVDRRQVGTPTEAITGAQLTFELNAR